MRPLRYLLFIYNPITQKGSRGEKKFKLKVNVRIAWRHYVHLERCVTRERTLSGVKKAFTCFNTHCISGTQNIHRFRLTRSIFWHWFIQFCFQSFWWIKNIFSAINLIQNCFILCLHFVWPAELFHLFSFLYLAG